MGENWISLILADGRQVIGILEYAENLTPSSIALLLPKFKDGHIHLRKPSMLVPTKEGTALIPMYENAYEDMVSYNVEQVIGMSQVRAKSPVIDAVNRAYDKVVASRRESDTGLILPGLNVVPFRK
jgi:hypothetical protein